MNGGKKVYQYLQPAKKSGSVMAEFSDFEDEEGVDEPVLSEGEGKDADDENIADVPLTLEIAGECLSLLCKTGNGLAHAYVRLDVSGRSFSDISILKQFIHLRYVDISRNRLRDISALNSLTHLLTLKADRNLLRSALLDELPYLQQANFSNNKISDLMGICHPLLEVLNLNGNDIASLAGLDAQKLSRLSVLELRGNKLQSTRGLYLPNLKRLYLAENKISSLEDISRHEHLAFLHLRGNNLSNLDGFADTLKNLQYLNLRKNNIDSYAEIAKLKCLPKLRGLVLRDNPVAQEEAYRIEVLVLLRRLERLDQDAYLDDERHDAEEISNQRAEAEAERRRDGNVEVIHSDGEN